jgi:hypothetical protein
MIQYAMQEKALILSFGAPMKTSILSALKKAFPKYTLTLTPNTVTFIPARSKVTVNGHQDTKKMGAS